MPVSARVEAAILACLALTAPAWGRTQGPCPGPPLLLAAAGPGRLGVGGPSQRSVPFQLAKPGRVWAEASGLSGLEGEDRDAAPEVFLDDSYLGPLLPEDGAVWRSPLAVRLPAGWHQLLVRCAQPGGLGPVLRWDALRVLTDRPCVPRRARARRTAKRPALLAAPPPVAAVPPPPPAAMLETFCGPARLDRVWPARLKGRDLVLSAPDGSVVGSGPLVSLGFGQAWAARLKIPSGSGARPFPLVARFERGKAGRVRFLVLVDRQVPGRVQVRALGYRPDTWEPFTVWLCPGHFIVRFAHEGDMDLPYAASRVALSLGALGLTLTLSPAP